ncbi:MAG: C-GCAxxG-C-C family protein [Spirochaetales bacterium]|nr:C-GCAxxG-C-C family protein [Spirochaetales bacterium]MCF7937005.1 C-GCAxxG-C-C family protein [Spirochaetales bacterium]
MQSIANREELIQKAYDLGFAYERDYRGCSQSTIAAVQDTLNIRNDDVFKAGSGLATGGGLTTLGPCGGYSGGVMVMSTLFGRSRERFDGDRNEKYASFRMAEQLAERFQKKYGSLLCGKIHRRLYGRSFDIWNTDERRAFEEAGAHTDGCTSVVGLASSWTAELILDELEKRGMETEDLSYARSRRTITPPQPPSENEAVDK